MGPRGGGGDGTPGDSGSGDGPPAAPTAGLCAVCVHHRWTSNRRGSSFLMCLRSAVDPRYPKYPQLPVTSCPGFEADESGSGEVD